MAQTLKNLPKRTRTALGKEAAAMRRGDAPTRSELYDEARRLNIQGRSKMGKAELKQAVARAQGVVKRDAAARGGGALVTHRRQSEPRQAAPLASRPPARTASR
jgi:hypothetical protein